MSTTKTPRLLDEVRDVMRVHHYSIHTERAYCDWIRRYVRFHRMASREDLKDGEAKIQAFLTHLAVEGRVAPSTRNQAMNALVFVYTRVLKEPLEGAVNTVRAPRKVNVPAVLTREEVSRILPPLSGTPQLVVKLLYGSGLRIMEALRLRVKDIDFKMKSITVRSGKGEKTGSRPSPSPSGPYFKITWHGSERFTKGIWPVASAKSIFLMPRHASFHRRRKNGDGNTCSRRGVSRPIP